MLKRKLLSVLLALVLVVSMAVPAFAAIGSGTYLGCSYEYMANRTSTTVYGSFDYDRSMTVSSKVTADLWCSGHTSYYYNTSTISGTGYAYAEVKNTKYVDGTNHTCVIQAGHFVGSVGSATVVSTNF